MRDMLVMDEGTIDHSAATALFPRVHRSVGRNSSIVGRAAVERARIVPRFTGSGMFMPI
jgi:hypothetical protein